MLRPSEQCRCLQVAKTLASYNRNASSSHLAKCSLVHRVLEGVIAAEWKEDSEAGEKDVCLLPPLIDSSFLFLRAKSPPLLPVLYFPHLSVHGPLVFPFTLCF